MAKLIGNIFSDILIGTNNDDIIFGNGGSVTVKILDQITRPQSDVLE